MQGKHFEWDDAKAASNITKNKVSFETPHLVLNDPGVFDDVDDTMDYGEDRFRAIGMVNGILIAVLYTQRDTRIRIISARPASRIEETDYVEYNPPR